jgi:hypothetical protein
VILTEAASGAYVVTPVLAAMAGARRVFALARSSRYGTVEEVTAQTLHLASLVGVKDRLEIATEKSPEVVSQADIITNSGHVRPIDAAMVTWMKPTAIISLMYEAWEFRPADVDLPACRRRGIPVVATNERHPNVDVFSFLGVMAIKLLVDACVSVYGSRILLLCDNPFAPFIERGLRGAGATVDTFPALSAVKKSSIHDAILVALKPRAELVLSADDASIIAERWPGVVVAQFWGDIDRIALAAADVPVSPTHAPKAGHMGILPSGVGPEPVVRLQVGGLKAAEVIFWYPRESSQEYFELLHTTGLGGH